MHLRNKNQIFGIIVVFMFTTTLVKAQIYSVGLELSYPVPTDQNFIGKNYQGIADFGIRFRVNEMNAIDFGLSLNVGMLSKKTTSENFNVNAYTLQPRIYFALNEQTVERFHPYVSGGYSLLISKVSGSSTRPEISDDNETEGGINFTFGMAYEISPSWYFHGCYDFIKIGVDNDLPKIAYNTNINMIKFGIGHRFK